MPPRRLAPFLVLAALLVLRLLDPEPLALARLHWFDAMQQALPREGAGGRTLVVAIDEPSLAAFGQWPWPRDRVAEMIRHLAALGAAVVVLDIVFAEPDRLSPANLADSLGDLGPVAAALRARGDTDQALGEAAASVPTIAALTLAEGAPAGATLPPSPFAVRDYGEGGRRHAPLPDVGALVGNVAPLQRAAQGAGLINFHTEPDGVLRRLPGAVASHGVLRPGLAVETARVVLGVDTMILEVGPLGLVRGIRLGDRFVPTDGQGALWLDASAGRRVQAVSAAALLRGDLPRERVAGRVAVIGVTAAGVADRALSPTGEILPGVTIQALATDSLLGGRLLRRSAGLAAGELAAAAALGLTLIALLQNRDGRRRTVLVLGFAAAPFALSLLAFAGGRLLADATFPGLVALGLGAHDIVADLRDERRARTLAMQRLRESVEAIAEGFALFGPDRRLVMANGRFRALLGAAAAAAVPGAAYAEIMRALAGSDAAPLSARRNPEAWVAARLTAFAADQSVTEEQTAAGRWLRLEERRTADGGLVGIYTDVTESRRHEEALDRARQQAELASRSKSDFLTDMSHELRTPLNAIIGFTEMVHRETFGPLGNVKYKEYMDIIATSAQHLLALISQILDLSRVEAGRTAMAESVVDLQTLIDEAVQIVRAAAVKAEIALEVEPGSGPVLVRAGRQIALQILLNLLSNAVKFTPSGGRVTVGAVRGAEGGLGFRVVDTGIGMPPEMLAQATERFWRSEDAFVRSRTGSGVGLALVKSFVDLHGGRLGIESAPGRGTAVTVLFPAGRVVGAS